MIIRYEKNIYQVKNEGSFKMINGKKVIALIPARGGSKGIPYKNIKPLKGKPLIAWTIEVAQQVDEIDRIFVSTDDEKIVAVSQQYGAEVIKRPDEFAQDHSLAIDVVKHAISYLRLKRDQNTIIVYLEPTNPLREKVDVVECLRLLSDEKKDFTAVATFKEAELNPYRAWKIENFRPQTFLLHANPWLPRQKLPKAYQLNGGVYAFYTSNITDEAKHFFTGKTGAVLAPKERSIDIDDEIDFLFAEMMLNRRDENENDS